MKITFGILCHNETDSLELLLKQLTTKKPYDSEIVIIYDKGNVIRTKEILDNYKKYITVYNHPLNNNFEQQKNYLIKKSTGDYIFNIDADELIPNYLLENIHLIIENSNSEVIWIPRINIVNGIEQTYINMWKWKHQSNEQYISEKIIETDSDEYKFLKSHNYIIEEIEVE